MKLNIYSYFLLILSYFILTDEKLLKSKQDYIHIKADGCIDTITFEDGMKMKPRNGIYNLDSRQKIKVTLKINQLIDVRVWDEANTKEKREGYKCFKHFRDLKNQNGVYLNPTHLSDFLVLVIDNQVIEDNQWELNGGIYQYNNIED